MKTRYRAIPKSRITASTDTSNWPDPEYFETVDEDTEEVWDNYLSEPEWDVADELQVSFEPSVQGSVGSMFIYDDSGEDRFEEIEVDYGEWCNTELDLAYQSGSSEEYKQKFKEYIESLIY